jgi:citronellol/citronellal dehydrogenase
LGTWNFSHAVGVEQFIPQKSGIIINIIAQIKRGFPGMVHTGAARAGVENMTKTLAVEWSKYNILVNAIAPGVIESTGTQRYDPKLLKQVQNSQLVGRLGKCIEVAQLITFLVSPAGAFITGQTYYIDGNFF